MICISTKLPGAAAAAGGLGAILGEPPPHFAKGAHLLESASQAEGDQPGFTLAPNVPCLGKPLSPKKTGTTGCQRCLSPP